jgi:hypothetical protein
LVATETAHVQDDDEDIWVYAGLLSALCTV